MRSTISLKVEITHSRNLRTDAQGLADKVGRALTRDIGEHDPVASTVAYVESAAIQTKRPLVPANLPSRELIAIVNKVRDSLWLDTDESGQPVWNPDKEWHVETIEIVADALIRAGLRPEGQS